MRFSNSLSAVILAVSCIAGNVACSSDSGPSGGGDCGSFASTICQKFATCAPFVIQFNFGNVDECKSRYSAICQAGLSVPGTSNYASQVASCSKAMASASCETALDTKALAGCEQSPGTFANGQACSGDAQCQSLFCNKSAGATCGACAAAPKAGDACTSSCGGNLTCTSGHCAVPVPGGALGASCSAASPCNATLTCFSGTCQTPTGAGQPCSTTTPSCDTYQGLTCQSGICSKIKTANPGETCGFSGSATTFCTGGSTCKTATGSSTGVCLAPADDGQSCDKTNGPDCKLGATCLNGKCTFDVASTCH